MGVVGTGFGDDVDDGAAGAALFSAVGIGRDAKLLYYFSGELVRSAIPSAGLREKGVVVVAAVDEGGVLESANAAEGEIAVGGGGQAARIFRDARGEQGEIGETAAVQRQIVYCAFVEQRGDGAGLGFDQRRRAGDGDIFVGSCDGKVIFENGGGADVQVQLGRDLGRHALGDDTGGVIAGRKQIESKISFGVAGRGITRAGCGVDDDNGGSSYAASGGILDRAANGSGGGVLGGERG